MPCASSSCSRQALLLHHVLSFQASRRTSRCSPIQERRAGMEVILNIAAKFTHALQTERSGRIAVWWRKRRTACNFRTPVVRSHLAEKQIHVFRSMQRSNIVEMGREDISSCTYVESPAVDCEHWFFSCRSCPLTRYISCRVRHVLVVETAPSGRQPPYCVYCMPLQASRADQP